jgi:hypothetical protein
VGSHLNDVVINGFCDIEFFHFSLSPELIIKHQRTEFQQMKFSKRSQIEFYQLTRFDELQNIRETEKNLFYNLISLITT